MIIESTVSPKDTQKPWSYRGAVWAEKMNPIAAPDESEERTSTDQQSGR